MKQIDEFRFSESSEYYRRNRNNFIDSLRKYENSNNDDKDSIEDQQERILPYKSFNQLYNEYFDSLNSLSLFYNSKESELGNIYYDSDEQMYMMVVLQFPDVIQLISFECDACGAIFRSAHFLLTDMKKLQQYKETGQYSLFMSYDQVRGGGIYNYPYMHYAALKYEKKYLMSLMNLIDEQMKKFYKGMENNNV